MREHQSGWSLIEAEARHAFVGRNRFPLSAYSEFMPSPYVGIPVVLFMEDYDINRSGYHDSHDTMANIDLDYAAALTAIAIETVAEVACAATL